MKNSNKLAAERQAISDQNRRAALAAAAHGQKVFPVIVTRHPDNPNKKHAVFPEGSWPKTATTDPKRINRLWDKYPDAAPGMMTGDNFVVDLDSGNGKDGAADYRALGLDREDALFAVKTPNGEHLYFDNPFGLTISGGKGGIAPGIDTRGHGGFVFAPGARTVFGDYRITRGDLSDLQHGLLTPVPKAVRQALSKPDTAQDDPAPGNADVETIRNALSFVSSDCGYSEWVDILMAVHHATDGSKHGLGLVLGWSAGHPEFSLREVQDKWRSFGKKSGPKKTADTLFARARENGWQAADPNDLLTDEDVDGADDAQEQPYFTDMTALLEDPAPPREWHVPDWIPAKTVHMLMGDGGSGKSLLGIQLAVATGTGADWLGHEVSKPGVALYYGAEDDRDELHRRFADVCRGLDVDPTEHPGRVMLRSAVAEDTVFATVGKDGKVKATSVLKRMEREIAAAKPTLVVLDTLANLHALDPNSQEQAKAFIGLLVRFCQRYGCTVLLLAHPSRTGMATGDGDGFSVGWSNSVRSRSFLAEDKDNPEINILASKKVNYGKRGLEMKMEWNEGCYVKVNNEYADASKAKFVFLDILDRLARQQSFYSIAPGVNYAPTRFAEEPEAEEHGIRKEQFTKAMKAMLKDGVLKVEEYLKPDRKPGKRLARGDVPLGRPDPNDLLGDEDVE